MLVGPSGCGKTTSLRMLAGLERATYGDDLDRRRGRQRGRAARPRHRDGVPELRAVPAHDRRKNLGVRHEGAARAARRDPAAGAGGRAAARHRRRCSTGARPSSRAGSASASRSAVRISQPRVFLMDEPLSNLDARCACRCGAELQQLHDRLGITTVYVTHDQVEAMTMGDRIALMRDGALQQVDTPEAMYVRPGEPVRRRLHRLAEDEPRARARSSRERPRRRRACSARRSC